MAFQTRTRDVGRVSEKDSTKTLGKSLVAGVLAILSTMYLLNPLPDMTDLIPFVGNLDEAAAAAVLLSCLSYFGLDLKRVFGVKQPGSGSGPQGAKPVPGKVVNEQD